MEKIIDKYNHIESNGFDVAYGRIPSNLIEGWDEIVFFFETSEEELYKNISLYEKTIQPIIDKIKYQNNEIQHLVSWRETRKEAVIWNEYRQTTLVSFRVRDGF